jgi:glycosyltransferase involved in cell wall biosynthesis
MLTAVIIGRNEVEHLSQTLASVAAVPVPHAIVYVDSASTDGSPRIAAQAGATVVVLEPSDFLCAAAGRYVGTLLAQSEWVLYLDGDMELDTKFAERIPALIRQSRTGKCSGYVGWYENRYPDGTTRGNILHQNAGQSLALTFGGALLIQRDAIMHVGNWDYRISSYEELDLHTRLKHAGFKVCFVKERMITHNTPRVCLFHAMIRMFFPFLEGSRRTCGIGQLLRARFSQRSLLSFLRHSPRPFVFLALVLLGACLGLSSLPWGYLAALLAILCLVCLRVTQGLSSAVVYLSFPLRIALGWRQYRCDWVPRVRSINDGPDSQMAGKPGEESHARNTIGTTPIVH